VTSNPHFKVTIVSTSNNSTTSKSCMIYPMVTFPVTLSDPLRRFQGHGVIFMPIDAFSVLCAQLTRDLLAIAKLLFYTQLGVYCICLYVHLLCELSFNGYFSLNCIFIQFCVFQKHLHTLWSLMFANV